jgi:hypothetical protein
MADSPLGPYKKCGVIIDNIYCDPNTWNNHGSIAEFKGQWYVFYHRSSQNRNTCRRVCAEPISFDENGYIREVEQTSQGASAPIIANNVVRARSACRMMGKCRVESLGEKEVLVAEGKGHWKVPDWAEYKYIDFGSDPRFNSFVTYAKGEGRITLKIDGDEEIASLTLGGEGFERYTASCKAISGVHTLWLFFEGNVTVLEFFFE